MGCCQNLLINRLDTSSRHGLVPKRAFGFALRPILGGDLYINDLQDIRRTCLGELDLFGHFFTLFMKWNERILMY
ncbi:Uncharacterised protein [Moraxella ovis]|nr:Uncharacterised protein [Moraxella ovis]STZ05680.1 Uncharacterised protein [Moraxella ovis]